MVNGTCPREPKRIVTLVSGEVTGVSACKYTIQEVNEDECADEAAEVRQLIDTDTHFHSGPRASSGPESALTHSLSDTLARALIHITCRDFVRAF